MNLISAFEQNLIEGLKDPDRVVETVISKIFFYKDRVFKVYKYDKFFFGDFSSFDFRKDFYEEDFYWNNVMAPDVYLHLRPVKMNGIEDYYIEMRKFDDNNSLTNLLIKNQIQEDDLLKISKEMELRINELTDNKKEKLLHILKSNPDIFTDGFESDRNLLYTIPSFISKEKTDKIIDFIKAYGSHEYFKNYNHNNLRASIDNHADNIVILDGKVELIDILPPKESWRIGDPNFLTSRLFTDVAVLNSEDKAMAIYKNNTMPKEIRTVYEIRSALIQMWCFFTMNNLEYANKYLDFAQKRILMLS